MSVNIQIDQALLDSAYQALRSIPGAFPRAVAAAANRTLETMRTDTARETKERYFVKSGDVRKTLTLRKARSGSLSGAMISRGSRKNISKYQITPRTPQAGRRKGFKGAVKREGGLKPLPEGTFMINTPNAGYVLFTRIRPGRSWRNIKHVHSPSIPQIIKNDETVDAVQAHAEEVFVKRLNHEVMRMLKLLP